MFKNIFKNIGPGTLVAAAFIGPGTVTLCTIAGVKFGMNLLWAMVLSIIATIVLQEMAARLGIVTQKGLSEVIREEIPNKNARILVVFLILSAIVIGNASYEAGNISGGILGLETLFGKQSLGGISLFPILIGIIAFALLYIGNYKFLERVLVALVLLMSISFVVTAIMTKPNIASIFKGALIPSFPDGSLLTIIGLIGTTVVPYNLFLHASLVKERWKSVGDLPLAKKDTKVSIILGGLVSMAIIISASAIVSTDVNNASDLAKGLEPLFGSFAKYVLAIGLFAAGITSAITAPLAAAYVAKGCLDWKDGLKSNRFRAVWAIILLLGVAFSSFGIKPIEIIKFAQIANGLLLPIITGILLWMMNKTNVLGKFVNTKWQNFLGLCILVVSILLGLKGILKVLNIL